MSWRVCRTCIAICNGQHEPMLATHELEEQRCPWYHPTNKFQCTLAAPHTGRHFNIEAPLGQQWWVDGMDVHGRWERWKTAWRKRVRHVASRFMVMQARMD